jgi:hypothetical protein
MMHRFAELPPPYQPFVVRDDFIVRADLFPLPGEYNGRREDRHFELDNQFERFLDERLAALERDVDSYRCVDTAEPEALAEVYWRLFVIFGREYPEYVQIQGTTIELCLLGIKLDVAALHSVGVELLPNAPDVGRRVADWLSAQQGIERFGDALALACQEDIVIMRLLPDGSHFAESLHVLLPSTWNPREKYQQSFGTIHEPVAESSRLIASAHNVMKAIVTKGPYVRFGLSLTTLPALDSHPDHAKPWDDSWLDDLDLLAANITVRIERQTTHPFPNLGRALFSVRIYNTPLLDLSRTRPDLIPRLAEILRSASPAIVAYKGMTKYAGPVAEWCERQTATDCA